MATQSNPSTKPKPNQTVERVSVKSNGLLAETIFDPTLDPPRQFAVHQGGKVTIQSRLIVDARQINPPRDPNGMIEKGVVLLPKGTAPYGSQAELIAQLRKFIYQYADVPPFWDQIIAHYILMTWVYDKFTALPYLRFLGEHGTGKSRCLQVAGHLCYKGITAGGATTASPLFRLIELYGGTIIADEADFKNSEAWADIIKIFNCGYMLGLPVLRSEKVADRYEPRAFDVFGPKIIANRSRFSDPALESRCITLETQETMVRSDIPRQLPPSFWEEAKDLRNKLLLWRFQHFEQVRPDESKLLHLEPRLTQIGTPIYSVSDDPNFREGFVAFLNGYGTTERSQRPQGLVVEAIRRLTNGNGNSLAVKEVAERASQIDADGGTGKSISSKRAGALIRSLGFKTHRTGDGYRFTVPAERLAELIEKYGLDAE